MSDMLQKIQENKKLNEGEKVIVQYIIDHLDEIPKISSRELARRTYSTSSSVSRLIKKLDFENYNDFKWNVATYLKNMDYANEPLESNEDLLTIVNKLSNIEMNIINQTKEMISMESLKQAADILSKYNYIDIIATDTNASLAEYLSHLLWGLGKIVNVYQDEDVQLLFSIHVPSDHAVMVISRYALSKHIFQIANNLQAKQIPIIIFTIQNEAHLEKFGTCVFYGCRLDLTDKLSNIVFYISLKYLFDLFYVVLLSQNYKERQQLEKILLEYYQ